MDIKEARELYEYGIDRDRKNRDEALADLRFRAGEQWDDQTRREREEAQRPCLTINRTGQFIRRIVGAARQNPPSIKVVPSGDPNPEADKQAEIREGLIRAIEQRSRAAHQYTNALDNAASCGIGTLRILTEYDQDDPFRQHIRIANVSDALSVVYDPDAKQLTKEDGMFAFVTGVMSPEAFKRKYPKARADEWARDETHLNTEIWELGKTIRVVEMFEKVETTRKMILVSNGGVQDVTDWTDADMADFRDMLANPPEGGQVAEIVEEIETTGYKVMRQVLNGREVLEEPVEFPSQHIPLIPVIGEQVNIGEHRVRHGVVRFMRDPQRLYNYWRTSAAELIALAPKAPFLATSKQIKNVKAMWDQAHKTPQPYLIYEHDDKAPGPPQRATQPEAPAAMWQEAAVAEDDMKGVTGIYDASLGAQGNETSGRAILARQREGDVGTYVYIDNLRHAIERVGVTIMDMLPRVYDTQRVVHLQEESGATTPLVINRTLEDGTTENELTGTAYEVRISTGPSFQSKKEETSQAILDLAKIYPQIMDVAGDILIENLDFPRADEIAERVRMLMQAASQPQPDPKNEAEAMAKAASAQKDAAQADKAAAETEGKTLENLAFARSIGLT